MAKQVAYLLGGGQKPADKPAVVPAVFKKIDPQVIQAMAEVHDTFKPKVEEKKEDEAKAEQTIEVGKKAPTKRASSKNNIINTFYVTAVKSSGKMKSGDSVANVAARVYNFLLKKQEEDTAAWEKKQTAIKMDQAESDREDDLRQEESKKAKKDKKEKKKSTTDIWDKLMIGVGLLLFAPEAEAAFDKLKGMTKDFGEKIKDIIKPPDVIDTPQVPEISKQDVGNIKPFDGSQKQFYDMAYSNILKYAKEQNLENPESVARLGAAQASLETGYGKHSVGNNYFGIKAVGNDPYVEAKTKEYSPETGTQEVIQKFKTYDTEGGSFEDYVKFLKRNKRYQPVLQAKTPEEAIAAQGSTGYATDPQYAQKLSTINQRASAGQLSVEQPVQVASQKPATTLASTTTSTPPAPSTVGEKIEKESRPVADNAARPVAYAFLHNVREVYIQSDTEDQMVFRDEYYDPKPQLVTR